MALFLRHRPPLPLLLVVFVAASHGAPSNGDSYDPSMCQREPYLCGNINITYPFYLSTKIETLNGSLDSYCGYPGLAISCDDDKPILRLGEENYTVTAIDGAGATVSLVDSEVLDENLSCPKIDYKMPSLGTSWLYLPTTVDYLLFLFNCSLLELPELFNITCGSSDDPYGPAIVVWRSDVYGKNLSDMCQRVIEVPVLKDSITAGPTRPLPSPGDDQYRRVLLQGFKLAWNESEQRFPPCKRCEKSSGQCGYSGAAGAFVGCLCPSGRLEAQVCGTGHVKKTKMYIVASTSCLLLLCLLTLAFFLTCKYGFLFFKSKDEPSIESFLQKNGNLHPKRYTYAEVKRMTKSFSVKLGQGGFGAVYRGNLSDGRQVAVKMLKDSKGDGEEFMNEVAIISRTSHVNVVMLLGFCLQGSKRSLIYEYMPNGSLERYAFNSRSKSGYILTWEKLFDIAIGIARGLEYLHRGCNTRIVHFDIKPHNILLDQDFCPKISDFGLAKLCLNKESAISIVGARGTIGYIAPEVYSKQFGTVSSKSDVYSYGMMVLEMVGARDTNVNANSESSSQYFPQWIYEHLDEYCISASEINGETTELVRKMIVVGLWCIQVIPTDRPAMTRVVEMLEGNTSSLELPAKVLLS